MNLERHRLLEIIERFHSCRLAVLGDVILDQYLWGKVDRISPEAPVPIVRIVRETIRPGGASNVAANLKMLGAKAYMVGVVGDDGNGRQLREHLDAQGIDTTHLVIDSSRPTTIKTRVVGQKQQMLRIDRETEDEVNPAVREAILARVTGLIPEVAGLIVSDYAKGVITKDLLPEVIKRYRAAGKFVAIDPRLKNFPIYTNATVITPNTKEAESVIGRVFANEDAVLAGGRELLKRSRAEAILMTRGEHGMTLFSRDRSSLTIPTQALEVFDVSGAGDTVISTFSLCLAAGVSMAEAAAVGNLAAGVVVGIVGTATVRPEQVIAHWEKINFRPATETPGHPRN